MANRVLNLGKEAKIGLAVITLLTIIFGVVLVRRLVSGHETALPDPGEEQGRHAAHFKDEPSDKAHDRSQLPRLPSQPTVLSAKQSPSHGSKASPADVGGFSGLSDEHPSRHGGSPGKAAPPSYMPNPPQPVDPYDRYAGQYGGTGGPSVHHGGGGAGAAPADPFRGRSEPFAHVDGPTAGQPHQALRVIDSTGQPSPYPAARSGTASDERGPSGGYSSPGAKGPTTPPYNQGSRFGYPAPPQPAEPRRASAGDNRFGSAAAGTSHGGSWGGSRYTPAGMGRHSGRGDLRREDGTYEVQPNDNYWVISEKLYGTGAYFKALAEHNRKKYPQEDSLQVGEVISAPDAAELEKKYAALCPKPSHREVGPRRDGLISTSRPYAAGRTYTVQEGDTLYDIARNELGKASRWIEIYDLNREQLGSDYHYLPRGLQLTLPDGEEPGKVTRRLGPDPLYQR